MANDLIGMKIDDKHKCWWVNTFSIAQLLMITLGCVCLFTEFVAVHCGIAFSDKNT